MVELTQALDLEGLNADQTLDALIEVRRAIDWLKARDASLLDRLDELAAADEIDQGGFTHNDWSFAHSDGKTSYTYTEQITKLEEQLKAAKDAAKANGTAVKVKGEKAFWTITKPKP
jgi:hypothetical protein